jgi:hypothetical protein
MKRALIIIPAALAAATLVGVGIRRRRAATR